VVAVGWQIYHLTGSLLNLGLIGLSQFLPFIVLSLFAGHAADRYDRRRIILLCGIALLICAAVLLGLGLAGMRTPWPIFLTLALLGIARAFSAPAGQAILPNLVAPAQFSQAVALNSTVWQVSTIAGPALGGLLYAFAEQSFAPDSGATVVYAVAAAFSLFAIVVIFVLRVPPSETPAGAVDWHSLLEGLRFVWRRKSVLGAISLDLFAVLFGGATALLPAFTHDVLHAGPDDFGYLRTAPGVGAAITAVLLSLRPITNHVGRWMFTGVAVFGVATIVFGLTRNFWVALLALFILGAGDMVSVFIRHLLVQLQTPDAIRGRVSAVNSVFIGASNELGEFESGLTAAGFGLVPAIVLGGAASLAVAVIWAKVLFPSLWRLKRLGEES
jgi:MFS family permease